MLPFVLLLAVVWGVCWALFLQFTDLGEFLAVKRTWLCVVIGVGVDMAIALLIVPWSAWWPMATIIAASSLGVIGRSLIREWAETREVLDAYKDPPGQ